MPRVHEAWVPAPTPYKLRVVYACDPGPQEMRLKDSQINESEASLGYVET